MVRPKKTHDAEYQAGVNYRLENPPDLALWRNRLHDIAEPIFFESREKFESYWPYVSNVWSYNNKRNRLEDGAEFTYYDCRKKAKAWKPKETINPEAIARSQSRGELCKATCKVAVMKDGSVTVEAVNQGHDHTLEDMDKFRRNDALRKKVEKLAWQNVAPTDILGGLQGIGIFVDDR
jgi:hypothetical protein